MEITRLYIQNILYRTIKKFTLSILILFGKLECKSIEASLVQREVARLAVTEGL